MSGESLEIERTYLLDGMPELPPGGEVLRIEQGYLPDDGSAEVEGRLRRTTRGGQVRCFHTIKRGTGLVRTEVERELPEAELERMWPATAGRRLTKTRHRVRVGDLTWEVDRFDDLDLVLAEVELPSADTPVELPPWLAPRVVRDVTEEVQYRNYELAKRLGRA